MTTATVYLRISNDPSGSAAGVERQREDCLARIEQRGWTLHAIREDNDVSAKGGKRRPGFEALLEDVTTGAASVVVAYALDRLQRNRRDELRLYEACQHHGVTLSLINGPEVDFTTAAGRFVADSLGSVARLEIELKSDRQKRANVQRAQNGVMTFGGRRPYGYTRADGRPVIVPHEADVLRDAAARIVAGASVSSIVADLNARGLTTAAGKAWTVTGMRRAVTNPRLTGRVSYLGEDTGRVDHSMTILDADTFDAVAATFTARQTQRGRPQSHFLSGIAQCGVCGAGVYGIHDRSKGFHQYLCRTRKHITRAMAPVDARVTDVVLTALRHRAQAPWVYAHTPTDGDTLRDLTEREQTLTQRMDDMSTAYVDGVLTMAQLTAATGRAREALDEIQARRAALHRASVLPDVRPDADVRAVWESFGRDRQRAIVRELVTVGLHPAGKGARKFNPDTITFDWRGRPPHVVVSCDHRPDVAVIRETNDDGTVRGWAPVAMTYNPITQTVTWDEPPTDPCCIPSDADLDDAVLHGRLSLP